MCINLLYTMYTRYLLALLLGDVPSCQSFWIQSAALLSTRIFIYKSVLTTATLRLLNQPVPQSNVDLREFCEVYILLLAVYVTQLDSLFVKASDSDSAVEFILQPPHFGQVVHDRVPLTRNSITWYRQKLGHNQAHHMMHEPHLAA